jgi:hypothetical protein
MVFTQSASTKSDTILAGKVVLNRANREVLYNTAAGETSAKAASPADTEWAFGSLSSFASLSYKSLESMRNGNLAGVILNKPMVMHIISEDIYMFVEFRAWGQHGAGGFSYTRSTPAVAATPVVSITSPSAGAVFTAPAILNLTASATVTGGTVTNVEFFAGSTLLGSATAPPFSVTATIAAAGSYSLTAAATAAGSSATSSPVNITVMAPSSFSLNAPAITNALFSFSYSTDPGVSYVVQSSSNLLDWAPVQTNVASGSSAFFSDAVVAAQPRYYRVGRLP